MFSNANKPILGICGGLQSINVYFGGSLNQNIDNHNLKDKLHKINVKENQREKKKVKVYPILYL